MHHEYKIVDGKYDIYEVDGDNEVLVASGLTEEQAKMLPHAEHWSKILKLSVGEVIAQWSVHNRYHIEKCKDCGLWNDELGHCQVNHRCAAHAAIHGRKKLILIDDLIQRVKYATPEHIASLRYVTIDGKLAGTVHADYWELMKFLANNENIVGGVEFEPQILHS